MRLTAKERILLHLLEYARVAEAIEVPPEVAQDGVAAAAGIELRHFTQYARPLLREELIQERTTHVTGSRQRRRTYALTAKGQIAAHGLRDRLRAAPVRVREAGEVRSTTFGALSEAIGRRLSLLALAELAGERGVLDLDAPPSSGAPRRVEMLADAPRIERFVGRASELAALTEAAEGPRIFVIRGVAGIGKSSLASRACALARGRHNLYWHGVRGWDTRTSILNALGEFLSATGRPGLRATLTRGDAAAAGEVLREDLPGAQAFLVFDDADQGSEEVLQLLRFLKDVLKETPDARMLVLTRHALRFYDRRDVLTQRLVREIDLGGLTTDEMASLLARDGEVGLTNLGRRLGGHPLFLELVRSAGPAEVPREALRDIRRFIEEEIYLTLTDPERTALKAASLYRVPVPRDALFVAPEITHDVVLSLVNRTLLRLAGADALQVHDTVREFFASILTPGERDMLGRAAATRLRDLAERERAAGNLVPCVDYLSNALQILGQGEERAGLYEALGDVEERLGDLPAALTAYREALRDGKGSEAQARCHRKIASALVVREQKAPAAKELDAGYRALGETRSVERGWLDLIRFGIAWREERWDDARESAEDALRIFRSFDDPLGEAQSLQLLGRLQIDAPRGDLPLAQESFGDALALAQALHDKDLEVKVRTGLAHLLGYRLGDSEGTIEQLAAIEALPGGLADPHARRAFLMLRGWFSLELLADCEAACSSFEEARDLGRRIHDPSSAYAARSGLAFCRYFRGDLARAREEFEGLASESDAEPFVGSMVENLWMAAECSLRLGDLPQFLEVAARFRTPRLAESVKARPLHALSLQAVERFLRGDEKGWRAGFQEAFRQAEDERTEPDASLLAFLHFYYGVSLRARGEEAAAREQIDRVRELLESQHLRARLRLLPSAEADLVETFRRAVPPSGAHPAGPTRGAARR